MPLYRILEIILAVTMFWAAVYLAVTQVQAAPTPLTFGDTLVTETLYQPKKKLQHWQITYTHEHDKLHMCKAERKFKDGVIVKAFARKGTEMPYVANVQLLHVDFEFKRDQDTALALLQIDDNDVYEVSVDRERSTSAKHAIVFTPPDDADFLQQFVKGRKLNIIINNLSYVIDLTESLAAHKALLECGREASQLIKRQRVADAKPADIIIE